MVIAIDPRYPTKEIQFNNNTFKFLPMIQDKEFE